MPSWTHAACGACYAGTYSARHPNAPAQPVRFREEARILERCCYCGRLTRSGIYTRDDPAVLMCRHESEDE